MDVAAGEESIDFSEPLFALLTSRDQHNVAPAIVGRRLRDSERDPLMRTIIPGISYPLGDVAERRDSQDSYARSLDLNSIGESPPPYAGEATSDPEPGYPDTFVEGLERAGAQHMGATWYEGDALRGYVLTCDSHSSVALGHILILEDDNLSILAIVTLGRVHHLQQRWVVYEATTMRRGITVSGVVVPPQPNCLVCVPFRHSRVSLWHTIEYRMRYSALPSTILRSSCVCCSSQVDIVLEAPGTASTRIRWARTL